MYRWSGVFRANVAAFNDCVVNRAILQAGAAHFALLGVNQVLVVPPVNGAVLAKRRARTALDANFLDNYVRHSSFLSKQTETAHLTTELETLNRRGWRWLLCALLPSH